jgi:hypothetical protein
MIVHHFLLCDSEEPIPTRIVHHHLGQVIVVIALAKPLLLAGCDDPLHVSGEEVLSSITPAEATSRDSRLGVDRDRVSRLAFACDAERGRRRRLRRSRSGNRDGVVIPLSRMRLGSL